MKIIPDKGNGKCKGPEVGVDLIFPRNSEEPVWQEQMSEGLREEMRGCIMQDLGGHLAFSLSEMGPPENFE